MTYINMYVLIGIQLTILMNHPGNYITMKIFNYMLEIDINSIPHKKISKGVLRGDFLGFGVSK